MKSNPVHRLQTLLLTGVFAGAFAAACSADIIYQDTFARASAIPLTGSAPMLDNTGGAATWTAGAEYNSDGTNLVVNNGAIGGDWQGSAKLPLDFISTYHDPKVQVDMKLGQAVDYLTIDFGNSDYWGWPGVPALLKLYGNGDVDVCQGPGWDGAFVKAHFAAVGEALGWTRLRIEYSNTLQTANFYVNGTLLTNLAVPDNAPMSGGPWGTGVGFNANCAVAAQVTNFLVTFGNENLFKPSITTQPKGETIFVGDPMRLSLEASGTLPLQYIWCTNNVPIPGPNASVFTLPSAAQSDSANYTVIITNQAGAVTSDVARVDVHLEAQSPLAEINFDDSTNNLYKIAYAFSDGANLPVVSADAPGTGVGDSTGFRANADATDFQNVSVTYAGFAVAVGMALPPLKTANLNFYEAYGSVRIENLLTTVTNAPGRLTVRFYIPNPTNSGNYLDILDVNKPLTLTSNFQAVAFVLNTADYGGASGAARFAQNFTNIVRTQFDFTADNFYNDFVQGPDCVIVVDNLKLASRHSPPITASLNAGQVVLHWDDPNLQLQGAVDVTGPYIVIPGAASSYPVPAASPYRFFRTTFQTVP